MNNYIDSNMDIVEACYIVVSYFSSRATPVCSTRVAGCAPFSNIYGLKTILVELDGLNSGVPSFLKSDNTKLVHASWLRDYDQRLRALDSSDHA